MTKHTEGQTITTLSGEKGIIIRVEEGYSKECEDGSTFAKSTFYWTLIAGEVKPVHEDKVRQ